MSAAIKTEWTVRRGGSADIPTIVDYNVTLADESEGKTLDRATVLSGVMRGLQRGDDCQYFLAVAADNRIGGQIMLTREWSDWRDGWIMWIQSVYVHPDFRGQGLFRLLLNSIVSELKQQPDVVGLRLYVENDNGSAQQVYLRSGFQDAHYRVLERMFAHESASGA